MYIGMCKSENIDSKTVISIISVNLSEYAYKFGLIFYFYFFFAKLLLWCLGKSHLF